MAAKGIPFPWRWGGGKISTNLDGIWGMSVERDWPRGMADMAAVHEDVKKLANFNLESNNAK